MNMSGNISLLVIGFLVGGIAASIVWAIVVSGRKNAVKAQRLEKEQIMASVGEMLAEADAVETNYRGGVLTVEDFRRGLGDKVNAVMRQLRTNMHILDAYFVKYAEQEAREYLRVIDSPERRRQEALPAVSEEAVEPASGFGVGELPAAPPTTSIKIAAVKADDGHAPPAASPAASEPEPSAPSPEADGFEPPTDAEESAPEPDASRERQTDVALEAVGGAADAEDSFEPVLHDTAAVVAAETFEPAVREEELVLGESAGENGVAERYVPPPPPPAQAEEDAFDFSTPAAAQGEGQWPGEPVDEFEAAFAQFEVAGIPPPPADTKKPAADHDHVFTETSSIDRGAILSAMGAAAPVVETPLFTPPPQADDEPLFAPPPQAAEPLFAPPPPPPPQADAQGITGDDVVDSIDSFFNLK